jgi:transposase-like protein
MSNIPDILRTQAPARILLICPDCGHENSEVADRLRGKSDFSCRGDGCDYSFDFTAARRDAGKGFTQLLRRFYAAFYPLGGQGAG